MAHVDIANYRIAVNKGLAWDLNGRFAYHWINWEDLKQFMEESVLREETSLTLNPGYDYTWVNPDVPAGPSEQRTGVVASGNQLRQGPGDR